MNQSLISSFLPPARSLRRLIGCGIVAMALGIASNLTAQGADIRTPRVPPVEIPPVLMDESGDRARPFELRTLAVEARIQGMVARTSMTMTFFNPGTQAMAGNLYVPLPYNATVSAYALDVGGVMVDGVPVERETARQVYRTIVARGIDPGLVEYTRGNVFKTRVFPIPARGSRTIRLVWLSPISGGASANAPSSYVLPFNFTQKVMDFSLKLEVVKPKVPPVVTSGSWSQLRFTTWTEGLRSEFSARDILLNQDLALQLPSVESDPLSIEMSENLSGLLGTGADSTGGGTGAGSSTASIASSAYFTWFARRDSLSSNAKPTALKPTLVTLWWDASMSRNTAKNDAILKTLAAWFKSQASNGNTAIAVDLVLVRETATAARRFVVRSGNTAELERELLKVVYDGASRLGRLPPPDKASDMIVLVSDGLRTIGAVDLPTHPAPLFALSAETIVDPSLLQSIAASRGGTWIAVGNEGSTPETDASRIGVVSYRLLSTRVASGNVIDVVPVALEEGNALIGVSGRLLSETAKLVLKYGYTEAQSREVAIDLAKSAAVRTAASVLPLNAVFWAQSKLNELMGRPDAERPEGKQAIRDLGLAFNLVTPGTSLIVLESLAQYVEFGIAPPASLPDLRRQWTAQVGDRKKKADAELKSQLDRVYSLWKSRMAWWERTFTYAANFKYVEPSRADQDESGLMPSSASSADINAMERSESVMPTTAPATTANATGGASAQRESAESEKKTDADNGAAAASIEIQSWQPDTPYIRELMAITGEKFISVDDRAAQGGQAKPQALGDRAERVYARYLELRANYAKSPSFYFDVGDFFEARGARTYAVRVWSVLAEMDLEAPGLLRILGYRLLQAGEFDLSKEIFENVAELRPEQVQSWRDLALVTDRLGQHTQAISLWWKVVSSNWATTPEIEVISLMELNAAIAKAQAKKQAIPAEVQSRFIKLLDTDIRIVLSWDTDLSDMDLWVIEPSGERAFYGHQETTIGGHVSYDITNGYGPEEYFVRKAMRGAYTIKANYYGNQNPEVTGTVTVQVEVITNFGRPNEKREILTLSLGGKSATYTVGTITF